MKIAIRAGHNELATGCTALINEVQEGRSLLPHIIRTLRDYDNEVLDVTPGRMDRDSDLAHGVRKANEWGADIFVSIHFNKVYTSYNGKIGAECWVYSKSDGITLDEQVAQRIVDKLAGAGFVGDNKISRGVKVSNELYELKQTKMAAVIVEVCFVEATGDVELYKSLGHKKIGQLIAAGIDTRVTLADKPKWIKDKWGWWYDLGDGTYPKSEWKYINNEWYFFGQDGYAFENKWINWNGKWYWLNQDCKMVKSCALNINGKWYAFNAVGEMIEGNIKVNSNGDLIL